MIPLTLTRRYRLPALHALENRNLSEEANRATFGSCFRLHGHDYQIEVTVSATPDPVSGLIIQRDKLDGIVERELIEPMRGHNLNDFFPQTTGEALVIKFFERLEPHLAPACTLVRLGIRETARNLFEMTRHD